MRVSSEFSKYALHYDSRNVIQNRVIDKLLNSISKKPQYILDLGCGSGALCKKVDWKYKHFTGIDFAPGMLELHPKSENIECIYGDFNDKGLFENLCTYKYDYIFSASALQWAENLNNIFQNVQKLDAPIALAIFTSNTFKILNETASLEPMLKSVDEIDELQKKYFDANFEVVEYKLEFKSVREMFKYIKQSGVSGARKVLDYKQTKKLMNNYPVNYLEFEVAFITSR
ncbi:MAG: methyltransferase domain-containing protein [Campylobacterota bacterium]|nr:methyltransferase domain-containing protein [Campylobacterota bacterium]